FRPALRARLWAREWSVPAGLQHAVNAKEATMRSTRWTVLVLAVGLALPVGVGLAQDGPSAQVLPLYTTINLGTLGGSDAVAYGINRKGWIGGTANLKGNTTQRGALWLLGLKLD